MNKNREFSLKRFPEKAAWRREVKTQLIDVKTKELIKELETSASGTLR